MTESCDITHRLGRDVAVEWGGVELFRYDYSSALPQWESPRPYFHPLRTLGGNRVTGYRPHDHPWHHGLSMTTAHLSGENFWGGPTFVRDEGYVARENTGTQQHTAWHRLESAGDLPQLEHELAWITHGGNTLIAEHRSLSVGAIAPDDGHWRLEARFRLENMAGEPLAFGSPTTEGRPNAGYGSLFWRGARDLAGGRVLAAEGLEGEEAIRGHPASWLAFVGTHDESLAESTLVFVDRPSNPRYPNKWFVRSNPFPAVSFSFLFDEHYLLEPGETLDLGYALVLADGARERNEIERLAESARR